MNRVKLLPTCSSSAVVTSRPVMSSILWLILSTTGCSKAPSQALRGRRGRERKCLHSHRRHSQVTEELVRQAAENRKKEGHANSYSSTDISEVEKQRFDPDILCSLIYSSSDTIRNKLKLLQPSKQEELFAG